jgi:hypothetical protein
VPAGAADGGYRIRGRPAPLALQGRSQLTKGRSTGPGCAQKAATSGYAGRAVWGAFIGGAFAAAGDQETFAVTEPATGGTVPVWPPRD